MSTIHNLFNNQTQFFNQKNFPWNKLDFSSRTDARIFYNRDIHKELFFFIKRLGLDEKHIRVATSKKVPIDKGWTQESFWEKRTIEQLIKKYQEYGARTGTKIGSFFFEVLDIDIDRDHVPFSLRGRWRINFELLMKRKRVSYIRTARGYQVYLLLEDLSPNSTIYHTDKFGKKRIAGSILAQGRQAQGVGSQFKKWVDNGTWFWKLKNMAELTQILAQYFFIVENKGNSEPKIVKFFNGEQKKEIKIKEICQSSLLLVGKRRNIQATILNKQKIPSEHLWKIFYRDKQNQQKDFFLLNNYQKPHILSSLEIGGRRNIRLVSGWKHRFLSKIF